jgi:alpha-mannosidase
MENQYLTVTIDPLSGNITKLINRATGRNFTDVKVNGGLNAFRWLPANIDKPIADSSIVITTVEDGPLIVELRADAKAAGCRSVSRKVRLIKGQPWIEISNVVDKLPMVEKDGIHFGFGFDIPHGKTRVDIPWGVMEVERDQWPQGNRNWIAMQRWLDISNDKEGVTWCSLDAPLFEYGKMTANISLSWGGKGPWLTKLEPSSTVYSWVMNNHWHTNFPLTQEGPVTFRYRILPHLEYNVVDANRFGMEQSQPLVHVAANDNPKINPIVALDNEKVYVTIIKPLSVNNEMIIRLRSLSEKPEKVNLSFPSGVRASIFSCPVGEESGDKVTGPVSILPYGMATLRLKM